AGGTAFGLLAFLNAELKPGIDIVIEHTEFESYFTKQSVDLLLTGEGKIDAQTNSGKVVSGLAEMANRYNVLTMAISCVIVSNLINYYLNIYKRFNWCFLYFTCTYLIYRNDIKWRIFD